MGIKRNALKKLALAVAVPGMTAGALAGFAAAPAMAGTAQPHYPVYERIAGFSNGFSNNIAVQVTGGFFDHGDVRLTMNGGIGITVDLTRGTQTIAVEPTSLHTVMHQATCSEDVRVTADLFVLGGTGAYTGLSGEGTATLTGSIAAPRLRGGGCAEVTDPATAALHLNVVGTVELYPGEV